MQLSVLATVRRFKTHFIENINQVSDGCNSTTYEACLHQQKLSSANQDHVLVFIGLLIDLGPSSIQTSRPWKVIPHSSRISRHRPYCQGNNNILSIGHLASLGRTTRLGRLAVATRSRLALVLALARWHCSHTIFTPSTSSLVAKVPLWYFNTKKSNPNANAPDGRSISWYQPSKGEGQQNKRRIFSWGKFRSSDL